MFSYKFCCPSVLLSLNFWKPVRKLLSAGTFFFARETSSGMPFDLTLSIQNYHLSSDFRFLWNKGLMAAISRVGICPTKWLTPLICGQFDVKTVYSGSNQSRVGLVSRISTEHPGTRFNVRGVNDDGDVANFVETEQVCRSFSLSLRGTVPLFWEQPGIQVGSHKIKLSRLPNTSLQAFQRHFADILSRYGETVIINLMGSKEGEALLSAAYKEHLQMSDYAVGDCSNSIAYHHFDYHAKVTSQNFENLQAFLVKMSPQLHAWDFFHMDGSEVKRLQKGVVSRLFRLYNTLLLPGLFVIQLGILS
ncbi:unnamed protein product [Schistocephalus solidus]|uniref:Phosphatidylinositol-3-phosphatase SAC1 n=1 Tax=Schistocephalus solidus TaxID=70667 RepID=A0A3P7CHI6_SCHSO|nr:unnamed protein product [Schistocephalus solidus]